jgi:hypothetical protein
MTSLQRRLQKLELRSLAYGLAAQPDGESKRIVMERIEAIRQRRQALGIHGELVPRIELSEVKARLRACLEDMRSKRA